MAVSVMDQAPRGRWRVLRGVRGRGEEVGRLEGVVVGQGEMWTAKDWVPKARWVPLGEKAAV
ncbi:hypothetical protein FH972_025862 [Carpinus fangiana]|uniref:Uncharacterized protein n=1 Tax=Carpinus fangiana TaxID=176857 RepID=A0A5N6L289_9ROSI|nr:hypothetical protein FH972_025862 [Carpinus fangiana]